MHAALSSSHHPIQAPSVIAMPGFCRPQQITLFSADSEIYAQGDRSGTLYRIEFGAVRIYRLLADGRRQVVAFHFAGETFGFEADRTRSFFAETMVETGLRTVGGSTNDQPAPDLMTLALRGMIRAQEHLLVVGRQSAVEKLAVFLIDLAERQGDIDQIDLPMTRTDIGDYLSMTIETVSRSFSKLRASGILRLRTSRCVEILKPEALRRLSK
jgi:CRP/FNR family nitrogen fixation transcriptional regulator